MKKLLCRHGSFVTLRPIGWGRDPTSDWPAGQGLSRHPPISRTVTSRANIHRWNAGEERLRTVECGGDVGLREADDDGARGARTFLRSLGFLAFSASRFCGLRCSLAFFASHFCGLRFPLFLWCCLSLYVLMFSFGCVLFLDFFRSSLFAFFLFCIHFSSAFCSSLFSYFSYFTAFSYMCSLYSVLLVFAPSRFAFYYFFLSFF